MREKQNKQNRAKSMPDEGYYALTEAIIMQTIEDFKRAYLRLKRCPDDQAAAERVKEITSFFCGGYFSSLFDVNGPGLLKRVTKKIDEEKKAKKKEKKKPCKERNFTDVRSPALRLLMFMRKR